MAPDVARKIRTAEYHLERMTEALQFVRDEIAAGRRHPLPDDWFTTEEAHIAGQQAHLDRLRAQAES